MTTKREEINSLVTDFQVSTGGRALDAALMSLVHRVAQDLEDLHQLPDHFSALADVVYALRRNGTLEGHINQLYAALRGTELKRSAAGLVELGAIDLGYTMSAASASLLMGLCPQTVRKLVRDGEIAGVQYGSAVRVSPAAAELWLQQHFGREPWPCEDLLYEAKVSRKRAAQLLRVTDDQLVGLVKSKALPAIATEKRLIFLLNDLRRFWDRHADAPAAEGRMK